MSHFTCCCCGKDVPATDVISNNGKRYCISCYAKATQKFKICFNCNNEFPESQGAFKKGSKKWYCNSCLKEIEEKAKGVCDCCKKKFDKKDLTKIDSKFLCKNCYDKKKESNDQKNRLMQILTQWGMSSPDLFFRNYRQLVKLEQDNNWCLNNSINTLEYVRDSGYVTKFQEELGVRWIVEKYYVEAQEYYENLRKLNEYSEDKIDQALSTPMNYVSFSKDNIKASSKEDIERIKDREYGVQIDIDKLLETFYKEEGLI